MSTYTENSRTSVLAYTVISWNMPTGDKLKWLLKEGGGEGWRMFESCGTSVENTPTLHAL